MLLLALLIHAIQLLGLEGLQQVVTLGVGRNSSEGLPDVWHGGYWEVAGAGGYVVMRYDIVRIYSL